MADMVTKQELEEAKIDVKHAGEAVNTKKVITPRYGAPFKSLPLVAAEAQAKADEVVAQGFYRGYTTEALLLAAKPAVAEMRARADNTRKIYRWNRTSAEGVTPITGTWVDTGLSDKDLAAADATTKADAAKTEAVAEAKTYTDSVRTITSLVYQDDGNLAHEHVQMMVGKSLTWNSTFVASGEAMIIPVIAGDELFIHNSTNTINGFNGSIFAFFTGDPSKAGTVYVPHVYKQEAIDGKAVLVVPVPEGADYLVANTKYQTYTHQWAIYKDKPSVSFDGTTGTYRLSAINSVPLAREISRTASEDIKNGNIYEDYYHPDNLVAGTIASTGAPSIKPADPLGDTFLLGFPVSDGDVFYMRLPIKRTFPFKIIYVRKKGWYLGTSNLVPSFYIQDAVVVGTTQEGIYKVTVPSGLGIKALLMTVKQTVSPDKVDMSATLSVQKNGFNPALVGSLRKGIASIDNLQLVDNVARQQLAQIPTDLNRPISRFANKKVFAIGDSITANTAGYVSYVANAMGTALTNFGSISAKADRMVDIVTAGSGLAKRDSATAATVWATPDFTDLSCAFIMIGTNHLLLTETVDLTSLPTDTVYANAVPNDYWNKFPNTFVGNIALVIEYVKWKAPQAEIYIISPPHNGNNRAFANSLLTSLKAVTDFYSIPFIDGTNSSGISFKLMNDMITPKVYSDDKVHLNALGNKMFGTFVAQKILSFG